MKSLLSRRIGIVFALVFVSALFLIPVLIGAEDGPAYNSNRKEFYLEQKDLEYIRPGLNIDIEKVDVAGDTVTATIRIADDKGVALDRTGVLTPGVVRTSFVLARINKGDRQYTNYITTGAGQPGSDPNGMYAELGDGRYSYTFNTRLPAGYDPAVTHSVGIYSDRDLSEFGLPSYIANAVFDFVPSGGPVTVVRDVVRTENCNRCHDPLTMHGRRREIRLCVLCHQPQNVDPDTGNTVNFPVLIHKIHRGADLPSSMAGTPYQIIGFGGRVFDWSEVKFPQDIRNCTVCHQKGTQSDNYLNKPGRAACGACHDDVNFDTGEHHGGGGVQLDDTQCTLCHAPQTGREFDISVKGAHTIPWKSSQLAGLNPEILSVDGAAPGRRPTVVFKITDNQGALVDPSTLDRVRLGLGGPTNDSVFGLREDARQATPVAMGYSHTFAASLPQDASGTWVVGTEIFRDLTLPMVSGGEVSVREAPDNQLFFLPITDGEPVRRRTIVSSENCNVCHDRLALHGTTRQNVEYCPTCHRPGATDEDHRPADQMPAETMDFKNLVHKIHSGHDLEQEFTIYDEGQPENFNEVHFPGDRRNCAKCHVDNSNFLPLRTGLLSTITPRGFFSPTPPTATACLACHDNITAAAHAFVNIAPFGEGCAACHGEGREFAVSRVHAR